MKIQSGLRFAVTALLVSGAGFVIAQSGTHLSAALAESTLTPTHLLAQNMPDQEPAGNQRGGKDRGKWMQGLNLSTDQQAKIKTIREQEKSDSEALRNEMKTAWEKMQSLSAGNATDAELRQQHEQVQRLGQQLGDRRFETMLKIRAVLTPEQRTKMGQMQPMFGRGHHGPRAHGPEMLGG